MLSGGLRMTPEGPRPGVTVPETAAATQGQAIELSVSYQNYSQDAVSIDWDWDYDGYTFQADAGAHGDLSPTHTYLAAGRHVAAVRVKNSDVRASIRTISVDVASVAPTATVAHSGPTGEGEAVWFTITDLQDVNPDADFGFLVDWTGSGEDFVRLPSDEYTVGWAEPDMDDEYGTPRVASFQFSHVWPDGTSSSTMPVMVRVLDQEGAYTDYPLSVPVLNRPPTVFVAGPSTVAPGHPMGFVASDPSYIDVAEGFTFYYSIDGGPFAEAAGGTYQLPVQPGSYWVRAYGVDKDGGQSAVHGAWLSVSQTPTIVTNESGGRIRITWAGGTAELGPGGWFQRPEQLQEVAITLLQSNAYYTVTTNTNISTFDASGVTGVNIHLRNGDDDHYSVAPIGDGRIGEIRLAGTASSPSTVSVSSSGDLGAIRVPGAGNGPSYVRAGNISAADIGIIEGLDRIDSISASGWIQRVTAREGIGLIGAFGISDRVTTTAPGVAAQTPLDLYLAEGGTPGVLEIARLRYLRTRGDINSLVVGKLEGNLDQTAAAHLEAVTIMDAQPGTHFNGKDGLIGSLTYGEAAQAHLTVLHFVTLLTDAIMLAPSNPLKTKLMDTMEGLANAADWEAVANSASWEIAHKYPEGFKARLTAKGINRDALENVALMHREAHIMMDQDGWRKWVDDKMTRLGLNPQNATDQKRFWKQVDFNEVVEQANKVESLHAHLMMKKGALREQISNTLSMFDGSYKQLRNLTIGRASRLKQLLPFVAVGLPLLELFFSNAAVAANIANPSPQAQQAFTDFATGYNLLIEKAADPKPLTHNEVDLLIDKFNVYLTAIGVDQGVKDGLILLLKKENDLKNP